MRRLKIFAFGTKYFMDTYSHGLRDDCDRLGYDMETSVVKDGSFSTLNHEIQNLMLSAVKENNDRICFMDPECRIVKPIPQEWIDSSHPVVFYKINDGEQTESRYHYGQTLVCPIIMQPIFLGPEDLPWLNWWMECSLAGSDIEGEQYVPHELFLEIALRFNKIKIEKNFITYNRDYTGKHLVVKGSWKTDDTIIQHPAIQGVLDARVKHANERRKRDPVLHRRELHNHFQDTEILKRIDQLMYEETNDISQWPDNVRLVDGWFVIEDWKFDPTTGLVKHKNFDTIKYHHSLQHKIEHGIKTPVLKKFIESQFK